MAARRLIAILLVLLFLSSLAAALAPVQERVGTDSSSTTSSTATAPTVPGEGSGEPRLIEQTLDADAAANRSVPIRAKIGDRLELKVTSRESGTVELSGIGPAEDVGPRQPAFFDVLLRDAGDYPVRFLGSEDEFARIEVSPPRAADPSD